MMQPQKQLAAGYCSPPFTIIYFIHRLLHFRQWSAGELLFDFPAELTIRARLSVHKAICAALYAAIPELPYMHVYVYIYLYM